MVCWTQLNLDEKTEIKTEAVSSSFFHLIKNHDHAGIALKNIAIKQPKIIHRIKFISKDDHSETYTNQINKNHKKIDRI